MCWSLPVSIGSYAIVCALAAVLLKRNWQTDRWFALWLVFVGHVQLLEAVMWLDQGCGGLNQATGVALLALISLEPVAHCLIALRYIPGKPSWQLQALAVMAAANVGVLWAVAVPGTANWCSRPCGADGHLKWPWAENINDSLRVAFLVLISAPFAFMHPASHGAAGAAMTAAIFVVAFTLFRSSTTFESMWCWLATLGFVIPLLFCRPTPQHSAAAKAKTN